jgi:hypothetical protein
MPDNDHATTQSQATLAPPDLKSLDRLVGTWKVSGPDIDGQVAFEWLESGFTFDCVYENDDASLMIWGGEKGSPAYYKGAWSADGNMNAGAWVYPSGDGYKSTMTRIKDKR